MVKKKKTKKKQQPEDKMKFEIAQELGLLDKVLKDGWGSLTAKETGKIGGLVTRRKLELKLKQKDKIQDQKPSL